MRKILPLLALLACVGTARADDTPTNPMPADAVKTAREMIAKKDFRAAIPRLLEAARQQPQDADIQNLLGFCYRKTGDLDRAFRHYGEALRLNPSHLGAHEYVGEAYVMKRDLPKAEEHLRQLEKLCGTACEEYRDLARSIAAARAGKG